LRIDRSDNLVRIFVSASTKVNWTLVSGVSRAAFLLLIAACLLQSPPVAL
jgi:hypothetical protein